MGAITSSRFHPEQIARLTQSVLQRSLLCSTRSGTGQNNTQSLSAVLEYGKNSMYSRLEAVREGDWPQAVALVGTMATELDLHSPSEQTCVAFATLACVYAFPSTLPTPAQSLSVVQQFKTSIRGYKRSRPDKPTLWSYPPAPSSMPQEMFRAAYPNSDDGPVSMISARFHLLREHMVTCHASAYTYVECDDASAAYVEWRGGKRGWGEVGGGGGGLDGVYGVADASASYATCFCRMNSGNA